MSKPEEQIIFLNKDDVSTVVSDLDQSVANNSEIAFEEPLVDGKWYLYEKKKIWDEQNQTYELQYYYSHRDKYGNLKKRVTKHKTINVKKTHDKIYSKKQIVSNINKNLQPQYYKPFNDLVTNFFEQKKSEEEQIKALNPALGVNSKETVTEALKNAEELHFQIPQNSHVKQEELTQANLDKANFEQGGEIKKEESGTNVSESTSQNLSNGSN